MAILIDWNGLSVASYFAINSLEIGLLRHSILNSIRIHRKNFYKEFGEIVICCDEGKSWRKTVYPNYKILRGESTVNWYAVYNSLNQIRNELIEEFPYKVVYTDGAEADDIIAVLTQKTEENHLVVSKDKDMMQLLKLPNVKIYSPTKEKLVTPTREYTKTVNKVKEKIVEDITPNEFLVEQIIRGDRVDSVPNFLSDDNVFAEKRSQKSLDRLYVNNLVTCLINKTPVTLTQEQLKNLNRNKKMISLFEIPEDIQDKIVEAYKNAKTTDRNGLFNYFFKNQLKELSDNISDF